jgi:adenylate kinase family enzyme
MALNNIERVLVVGPIGAGKTYAAQRIAMLVGKPLVQIDRIMLDSVTGKPKAIEDFLDDAAEYFAQPELQDGWVADGSYRSLRNLTWEQADVIGYIRPRAPQNFLRLTQRSLTKNQEGGNSNDSYLTCLKRLHDTRVADLEKLDGTTSEFRELGTEVLVERSSSALVASFALLHAGVLLNPDTSEA